MYCSYKINTSTNLPGFDFGEFSVVRRFNDFVWLCDQLAVACPGAVIPALPDKQVMGKFTPDFVESRRRALERFITRVASHPQLVYASAFVSFLQADDNMLTCAKNEAKDKKKSSTNPIAWLESLTNNKIELDKTAADMRFEEIQAYLTALEVAMEKASKAATLLVKRDRQVATAMFEYGQTLTWLGEAESDTLGTGLCQVGSAVDVLSQSATRHSDDELVQLDEPLQEYVRLLASLREAIKRRGDKKKLYANAIADLESKQQAYHKVAGQAKEDVERAKQMAVEAAQTACNDAKECYERVSSELQEDFERFKAQKANDIRDILMNFVQAQSEHVKKSEDAWRGLIPTLQNIQTTAAAAPTASYGGGNSGSNPFDHPSAPPAPDDEEDMVGV